MIHRVTRKRKNNVTFIMPEKSSNHGTKGNAYMFIPAHTETQAWFQ